MFVLGKKKKAEISSPSEIAQPTDTLRILRIAAASRVAVVALIVFWRLIASPYDTSSSLNPPCLSPEPGWIDYPLRSVRWPAIGKAIEDSIVWDGVYFVRIAECGYEYEQTYAFLPLLPLCISFLARSVFAPLVPLLGYRAVLGLSAYILNNLAFCLASVYFYWLSFIILKDSSHAFQASIFFCFNPASIFYSSVYSESLYALLSFGGLYHLLAENNTKAMILLAFSGSARSNGLLNAGYFCFRAMHQACDAILKKKKIGKKYIEEGSTRSILVLLKALVVLIYKKVVIFQLDQDTTQSLCFLLFCIWHSWLLLPSLLCMCRLQLDSSLPAPLFIGLFHTWLSLLLV